MTFVDPSFQLIADFFEGSPAIWLELPDGWFGRPYDNLLTVVDVSIAESGSLVILFEHSSRLTVESPFSAALKEGALVLGPFAATEWEYAPFGETSAVQRRFVSGTCTFHAPGKHLVGAH
ncbi:hypothetical protein FB468_3298 [Leucobacter komagatae]|uniref:Uncharacterized protein n=1 Tax=Leucobacter komagatae TaxID=55969 RepID=A0A542XY66_9MICO|nr:hypothetical protein [Leucobacter komagatae]TQL40774.1 hypothetical protein FB468_3298 [Leucobacter komagatae]